MTGVYPGSKEKARPAAVGQVTGTSLGRAAHKPLEPTTKPRSQTRERGSIAETFFGLVAVATTATAAAATSTTTTAATTTAAATAAAAASL